MFIILISFLSCIIQQKPPEPIASPPTNTNKRRIGLQYERIPEGLLILKVVSGMGADESGIEVGDIITEVSGVPVSEKILPMMGPAGTTVQLQLLGNLDGHPKNTIVERGLLKSPVHVESSDAVKQFRITMMNGTPAEIGNSIQNVPVEQRTSLNLMPSLRIAQRDRRWDYRTLLEMYHHLESNDPRYWRDMVFAWSRQNRTDKAIQAYEKMIQLNNYDYSGVYQAYVGGAAGVHSVAVESYLKEGRRKEAKEIVLRLAETRNVQRLTDQLQMAPYPKGIEWFVQFPPSDDFTTTLLSGEQWNFAEQRGKVVVINFWATWCRPCQEELPELQQWYDSTEQDVTVLAVSTDTTDLAQQVQENVDKLQISFPVAHDAQLSSEFDISSIPAIRVFDNEGRLIYSARGYSETSIERLKNVVQLAQKDNSMGASLGWIRGNEKIKLQRFYPLANMGGLKVTDKGILIGVKGGNPLFFEELSEGIEVESDEVLFLKTRDLLAYLDGPVVANYNGLVVRAYGDYGDQRWMMSFPSQIQQIEVSIDGLWVLTSDELFLVNPEGKVIAQLSQGIQSIAWSGTELWAVNGAARMKIIVEEKQIITTDHQARVDASVVDKEGGVATRDIIQIVSGKFNSQLENRLVFRRKNDGAIIGVDKTGAVAFEITTDYPTFLSVGNVDDDPQDELLIAFQDRGLAIVDLDIP
jgi:thiol-disulfide isomerase/thioredoxin